MKKFILLLIATFSLVSFSINAHADLQQDIKDYLSHYKNMLNLIKSQKATNEQYLLSGDYDTLNTQQLTAAVEVLDLIIKGKLDECCWVGDVPAIYGGFPSFSTDTIINVPNAKRQYHDSTGAAQSFTIRRTAQLDMAALDNILQLARQLDNNDYSGDDTNPDRIKRWELVLTKSLANIWDHLWWGFSYVDDSLYGNPDLTTEFRYRYAFACIVCFGAGFYDTSRLHTRTGESGNYSYIPTTDYLTLVTDKNFSDDTLHWMSSIQANNQYPSSSNWNGHPPLQVSTGPTYQGANTRNYGNLQSKGRMYQSHCHGSTELYKPLDPVEIIRDIGTSNQQQDLLGMLPYTNNADQDVDTFITDFGLAPFQSNMFPVWQGRDTVGGPYYQSYNKTGVGSLFYNDELDFHSMHNGRWMQLTQWARLTSPEEGTYFPLHGIPVPSATCDQG